MLAIALLASCGGGARWSERAARDRIMLVREEPPTLGFTRLGYQASAHPDLGRFLAATGRPDFLAETASGDRRYLILYYLDRRQAYACRTWKERNAAIEFAGPYAMTEKETELLRELQEGAISPDRSGIEPGRLLER